MAGQAHRIDRLRFELEAENAALVERFSARLEHAGLDRITQALARVLDDLVPGGQVLHLDRLDLDLGALAEDGQGLEDALARAVTDALPKALAAPEDPSDLARTLVHFLQTGAMPGGGSAAALSALMDRIVALPEAAFADLREAVRARFTAHDVRRRAVQQLPKGLLLRLVARKLAGLSAPDRAPALEPQTPWRKDAAAELTRLLARWAQGADVAGDLAQILKGSGPLKPEGGIANLSTLLPDHIAAPDQDDMAGVPPQDRPQATEEAHSHWLPAAGLVLLCPYIAPYLDAIGQTRDGAFADAETRARAVLVIHALASGDDTAPEPDLALAKLLCGLPLTQPVPRQIILSQHERDEASSVLSAVINHWPALGRSSVQGLRESFLIRPGRLTLEPAGPVLRVETHGIDVLLDKLPWPLSIQRTPFMTAPLTVVWR